MGHGMWDLASERGPEPLVFEVGACDCGGVHSCHVLREYRVISDEYVIPQVWDMCCLPETVAVCVWTRAGVSNNSQMLFVSGDETYCMVGQIGETPKVLEVLSGQLYVAALAAMTPVPADDPLVLELASITEGT